jgi:hypothetical protein
VVSWRGDAETEKTALFGNGREIEEIYHGYRFSRRTRVGGNETPNGEIVGCFDQIGHIRA